MRRILAAVVGLTAALAFVTPAGAITNGGPDGNGHPEVGALLAQQAFPDGTWEECTGTLISPTVFLTAEHCDEGVARVKVTFDSVYNSSSGTTYAGTWHGDPSYNQSQSDPRTSQSSSWTKRSKASRLRGFHRRGHSTG